MELNSESTRFFGASGDGTHVAEVFTAPVNYQDSDGVWRPIDTSVHSTEEGFENGPSSFDLFLPATLSASTLVRYSDGDQGLDTTMLGISLAAGEARDSSVVYRNVRLDTDVVYDVTTSGYRERVILGSAHASGRFEYRIDARRLSLEQRGDGSIAVVSPSGVVEATIPPPFAQDASDPAAAEVALDVSLHETTSGSYRLEVSVPKQWLDSPNRVFPVTVDPDLVTSTDVDPDPNDGIGIGSPLRLPDSEWSLEKNDFWVDSVIARKLSVYVGSNPTWDNLWDAENARPTVFARELQRFLSADYQWDGWYLRPPGG